jgi:hypothetical protein
MENTGFFSDKSMFTLDLFIAEARTENLWTKFRA